MKNFAVNTCAARKLDQYANAGVTHLLSIDAPNHPTTTPTWFKGIHRHVYFQDVESESEAARYHAKAPTTSDVQDFLEFGRDCLQAAQKYPVHLLIHCTEGASRSPAVAYAIVAFAMGPGKEAAALDYVTSRNANALPNALVVSLADSALKRQGRLTHALKPLNQAANDAVIEWINAMKKPR